MPPVMITGTKAKWVGVGMSLILGSAAAYAAPSAFVGLGAQVCDQTWVMDEAKILGKASVLNDAKAMGTTRVHESAVLEGHVRDVPYDVGDFTSTPFMDKAQR